MAPVPTWRMVSSVNAIQNGMGHCVQKRRVGETRLVQQKKDVGDDVDPCQSSPCGPLGKCIPTNQAQIPYYCQCSDGQNTMFKCADPSRSVLFSDRVTQCLPCMIDPCLPSPCGPGECEITASILNGYICRCFDGTIQMTNCSLPKSKELFVNFAVERSKH